MPVHWAAVCVRNLRPRPLVAEVSGLGTKMVIVLLVALSSTTTRRISVALVGLGFLSEFNRTDLDHTLWERFNSGTTAFLCVGFGTFE